MTYEEFDNAVNELTQLDDSPIPGMEEAFREWKERPPIPPPPQPSPSYSGMVTKVHRFGEFEYTDRDGIPQKVFNCSLDLRIVGGDEDGALVTYVNINNLISQYSNTSLALDIVKSAGIQQPPRSNRDLQAAIEQIMKSNMIVRFPLDWEAFCSQCYAESLVEQTGQTDPALAKQVATKAQKKVANGKATLQKSYKGFPYDNDAKRYVPVVKCPVDGHGDVMARCKITRFLGPLSLPF